MNPLQVAPEKSTKKRKERNWEKSQRLKRNAMQNQDDIITISDLLKKIPPFSFISLHFKSYTNVELNSFLLSIIFVYIFYVLTSLGVSVPSMYESVMANFTMQNGLSNTVSKFNVNFNFRNKHRMFNIYYRLVHNDKNDQISIFDSESPQSEFSIKYSLNGNEINVRKNRVEYKNFYGSYETETYLLCNALLPHSSSNINLEITIMGDLSPFKTMSVEAIVWNANYLYLMEFYRTFITIFGIVLLFHKQFSFLNQEKLVFAGLAFITMNLPSILFNIEKFPIVHSVQNIFDDIYSFGVLLIWLLFETARNKNHYISHSFALFGSILSFFAAFFIIFDVKKGYLEVTNLYKYIHLEYSGEDDLALFFLWVILIFSLAFYYYKYKSLWLDLRSYVFFASQLCHIYDEMLGRWGVVQATVMAKWVHLFSETVALIMLCKQKYDFEMSDNLCPEIPLSFKYLNL